MQFYHVGNDVLVNVMGIQKMILDISKITSNVFVGISIPRTSENIL